MFYIIVLRFLYNIYDHRFTTLKSAAQKIKTNSLYHRNMLKQNKTFVFICNLYMLNILI